jgi:hypothetical protein
MSSEKNRCNEPITTALRNAVGKIMREGIMTSPKLIAEQVYDMLRDEGYLTKDNLRMIIVAWIKQKMTSKPPVANGGDEVQFEFDYAVDLEVPFPIQRFKGNRKVGTDLVLLGDFGLAEISQHQRQQDDNVKAVTAERDRFNRYAEIVVPLLKQRPDWRWRDAIKCLSDKGHLATRRRQGGTLSNESGLRHLGNDEGRETLEAMRPS